MESLNQIVDPNTGLPLTSALWQQIALSLFGIAAMIISIFGAWLSAKLATTLPAWLNARIDQKFKDDIHDAAMTAARDLILSGKDPRQAATEGVNYMLESAKAATDRLLKDEINPRSLQDIRDIYTRILISKSPLAALELNKAMGSQPQHPEMVPHPHVEPYTNPDDIEAMNANRMP